MNASVWDSLQSNFFDPTFWIGLVVFVMAAIFFRKRGYAALEWFKRKSVSSKLTVAFVTLIALSFVASIPSSPKVQHYGFWFALPVVAFLVSTYVLCNALVHRFRSRASETVKQHPMPESHRRQRNLVMLGKATVWVWCCGWLLFCVAIGIALQPHVGTEILLRSAIASFNLFLMNLDSNIVDDIQDHDVLKGLLSCTAFAALLCTVLLIMSLVLSRLMAYLHIRHLTMTTERNHLYVFFGMDDASKTLANNIFENDQRSVIVFVENSLASREEEKTDGWDNFVSMLTHHRSTFLEANENERRALAIANCDISSLKAVTQDVLGNIGLDSLKALIQTLGTVSDGELHVFFLSENRDANVRATAILAKDDLIGLPAFQTTLYCHARRNSVNRIIEDMGLGSERKTTVKIVDSSSLAVEHLKRDVRNQPVSFVSVNTLQDKNPGTVSSEFVSLVMGFGETGEETVKFLYEYGAFVHQNATPSHSYRSPFSCYVLDKHIRGLEGHFIASIPGASYKRSYEYNENALIKFYPYDFRSNEFFTVILDQIATKLNYVVVAIGDDEENMTAALEILRYVRLKRENLDHFCIYVRAYEKGTFKHLDEVARHYNQRLSKEDQEDIRKIVLFGQNEEIYTYDLVVRDQFQEDGRLYFETYRSLQIDPANDEGPWNQRRQNTLQPDGKTTKWERMSKIRRKESQDRSNALHASTKIWLLEQAVGEANAADFALRALQQRQGRQAGITYPKLTKPNENQLMLNLAMCEHLRWNAAHEMRGYVNNVKGHSCDERTKQHNCLKKWEELDTESDAVSYIDDYKLFDYGVVETSFKLKYGQRKRE